MKKTRSSEAMVSNHNTTRRHNSEDTDLYLRRSKTSNRVPLYPVTNISFVDIW